MVDRARAKPISTMSSSSDEVEITNSVKLSVTAIACLRLATIGDELFAGAALHVFKNAGIGGYNNSPSSPLSDRVSLDDASSDGGVAET